MNCGLAYKCRICLILVCPDVLGWEMTRASQKKGFVGSSLLLYICFLNMDTRCRSQTHLHHVTFKVTSAYTSCPCHEGQKVKVECKNSGVSLLFEAPQCKHRTVPWSSALSRGRLEPAALKPLWDHKCIKLMWEQLSIWVPHKHRVLFTTLGSEHQVWSYKPVKFKH